MNFDIPVVTSDRRISARLILLVPDHGLRSNPRICFASRAGKPIRTFFPKAQSTVKTSITKPNSQIQTPDTARNAASETRLLAIL